MNTITPSLPIQFSGSIGSKSRGQPQVNILPQAGQLLKALVVETQPDNRFLLQIGESRISARSDLPLKVGQPLQLQVTSTSPQIKLKIVGDTISQFLGKSLTLIGKNLDISSLFTSFQQPAKSSQNPQATSTQPSAPAQQPGQPGVTQQSGQPGVTQLEGMIFKAAVSFKQSDNSFVLQTGESRIPVETGAPLRAGQSLQFQVVSTSPQVQVKIVGDAPSQLLGQPLIMANKPAAIAVLLTAQQKSSIFEILSPQSRQTLESFHSLQQDRFDGKTSGESLKQLVDRLGLAFENQLSRGETSKASATLKAALLEILSSFKNGEQITKNTTQLLTTLELFQLAQLQTDTGQQFIFPLPLPFLEQGYMLVDKNSGDDQGDGSGENQERRFSLHLKMTDIGNLQIDFFQSSEGLRIRFHTDSRDKSELVKENSTELQQALADVPLLGLSFGIEAGDPANELLRHIIPEGQSVLDTKV